jgi:hypothetical protein
VSCGTCGETQVLIQRVVLRINVGRPNIVGFSCPTCFDFIERRIDWPVTAHLMSAGAVPLPGDHPAEALEEHDGEAIGYDDILALHEEMDRIDAVPLSPKGLGQVRRAGVGDVRIGQHVDDRGLPGVEGSL